MRWPFHTPPQAVLDEVVTSGLDILLVVAVSTAAWLTIRRTIRAVIHRSDDFGSNDRAARIKTVGTLLQSIAGYGIAFVALLTVLSHLGVNTTALVTAAGVFSIAVGLGARVFISDVIGGFFIILENQFSVGDLVTLGAGPAVSVADGVEPLTVEGIGIRTSRFRDADGRLVIVGNSGITSVINHSRGPLSVRVDLLLKLETPLDDIARMADAASSSLSPELWEALPAFARLMEAPEGRLKARVLGVAAEGMRPQAEAELRAALQQVFLPHLAGAAAAAASDAAATPSDGEARAGEDFP